MKKLDVVGTALLARQFEGDNTPLIVNTSYGDIEEMTMDVFFRDEKTAPDFEWVMVDLAKGKTLDVGAGCGSHSLLLQSRNIDVTALEISEGACRVAKERGVQKTECKDYKLSSLRDFDTLTLVMNGIGVVGDVKGLGLALEKFESMLRINGQILFDTTDIAYLYDNHFPADKYYGEVSFQYEYKGAKGDWFNWLYLDLDTLKKIGRSKNWHVQVAYHDEDGHYVAIMKKR